MDKITVHINGEVTTPPSYQGETHFIIPDDIVKFCANRYHLFDCHRVLDPMCGIGTIPRMINLLGGDCIGVEIDEARFNIALTMNDDNKVFLGNFMDVCLPTQDFRCIFTSMPFDWFRHPNAVQSLYADKFKRLLDSDGFVLLDSVPTVVRAGETWPVASRQCAYLEENGFTLTETIQFIPNNNQAGVGGESVIMRFIQS